MIALTSSSNLVLLAVDINFLADKLRIKISGKFARFAGKYQLIRAKGICWQICPKTPAISGYQGKFAGHIS